MRHLNVRSRTVRQQYTENLGLYSRGSSRKLNSEERELLRALLETPQENSEILTISENNEWIVELPKIL